MDLNLYGWNSFFETEFKSLNIPESMPGRIIRADKTQYLIISKIGEIIGKLSGKFHFENEDNSNFPAIGDWVLLSKIDNEKNAIINSVLNRKSAISRKSAGIETKEQIVAANIDVVFIVVGLDNDFNLRRIERYLTMTWDSQAKPVILLNKTDLVDDPESYINQVETVAYGVPVLTISAIHNNGLEDILNHIKPSETAVIVGSSGVGKSTLINALLGEDKQKVNNVREDDSRGRHTTTHRELIILPNKGLFIDTPGMREIQLWSDEESLNKSFSDIDQLAVNCKFNNCQHSTEPGCAILEALEEGSLTQKRFKSYLKQSRELDYLARRQGDREEFHKHRNKWKKITKYIRNIKKNKDIY